MLTLANNRDKIFQLNYVKTGSLSLFVRCGAKRELTESGLLLYPNSLNAVCEEEIDRNEFNDCRIELRLCKRSVCLCWDLEYHNTSIKESNRNANTTVLNTAIVRISFFQLSTLMDTFGSANSTLISPLSSENGTRFSRITYPFRKRTGASGRTRPLRWSGRRTLCIYLCC